MPTFKELFSPHKFVSELGALRFSPGLFPDDEVRTPHVEMQKAIDAFMTRPQINSGIKQLALFLTGNNIIMESGDKRTKDFLNEWIEKRKDMKKNIYNFVISSLVTGNGFFEFTFKKRTDGGLVLDNFFPITDSSRVYRNLINENDDDYWIYEVPVQLKAYPFQKLSGELVQMRPKFYFINYVVSSSTLFRKSVYGIPIHKDKLRHFKWGWSRDMIYGRSFLASVIDDVSIVKEIIKNWSVISRYRALNSKIISIGNAENKATIDDMNKFEADMRAKREHEHIILNKPHEISSLSNVGEYDDMASPIDWLRRDVGSGLVPNYLTPWNSEVNRATSEEVRIVFQVELDNTKDDVINYLNKEIIGELRKSYPFLAEDATFVFQDVDLEPKTQKLSYAGQLYDNNIITTNEYRKMAGLEPVPDGDKYKAPANQEAPQNFQNSANPMENELINWLRQNPDPSDDEVHNFAKSKGMAPEEVEEIIYSLLSKKLQGAESFKEQFNGEDTDKIWRTRLVRFNQKLPEEVKAYAISKRANIGGKTLRLVKNGEGRFLIFNGLQELNGFAPDEKDIANAYFDKQEQKLIKMQDDFLTDNLPEDQITDELFEQLSGIYTEIVDEFFKEFDSNKKKEKVTTGEGALDALEKVFQKFNARLAEVIRRLGSQILNLVTTPTVTVGNNTIVVDSDTLKQLAKSAELLQRNFEAELQNFNAQKMQDIRRKLTDGITAGKPHQQIKDEIRQDVSAYKTKDNVHDWEIKRIIRTEVGKSSNLLKLQKWKQQGFDKYIWRTMEDERVRPANASQRRRAMKFPWENHRVRNQKVFDIENALNGQDIFPGGSLNPEKKNINCRCDAVLYI